MKDCIFCKIIKKEIPANIIQENDSIIAFRDIAPKAPVHILIVPKKHISGVNDLENTDQTLMGEIVLLAKKIAIQENIADSGYRLIINTGPDSGQEVSHFHCHLLGGKKINGLI